MASLEDDSMLKMGPNAMRMSAAVLLFMMLPLGGVAQRKKPAPLVVISIDGLRGDTVPHADEHGLKIPALRAFLKEGTWVEGVTPAIPAVTYPNHTTMITGVWPAEHGIYENSVLNPEHPHSGQLNENFSAIKVETIFQAAHKAGLKTAAVGWPVTLGAPIDYNIAEDAGDEKTDKPDGPPYNPPDLLAQLQVPASDKDDGKVIQTIAILQKFKPDVLFLHFNELDHQEHLRGPFSPQANETLETIDEQVAQVEKAALAVNPATRIAIVSDHGFEPVNHVGIDLDALFVENGLLVYDHGKTVKTWTAVPWGAGGGTSFIVLHDPKDPASVEKVRAVLNQAKADPKNGIGRAYEHDELVKLGGFQDASFLVMYTDEYKMGGGHARDPRGDTTIGLYGGQHGYLPSSPLMRASFMMKGKGIAAGRSLPVIDMRQIAPTFAEMIGAQLPAAKHKAVHYQP